MSLCNGNISSMRSGSRRGVRNASGKSLVGVIVSVRDSDRRDTGGDTIAHPRPSEDNMAAGMPMPNVTMI